MDFVEEGIHSEARRKRVDHVFTTLLQKILSVRVPEGYGNNLTVESLIEINGYGFGITRKCLIFGKLNIFMGDVVLMEASQFLVRQGQYWYSP